MGHVLSGLSVLYIGLSFLTQPLAAPDAMGQCPAALGIEDDWGGVCSGEGSLCGEVGAASDPSGRLLVLDEHGVQVFRSGGVYVETWELESFQKFAIAVDSECNVYVVHKPTFTSLVLEKFTCDGTSAFATPIPTIVNELQTDENGSVYLYDFLQQRMEVRSKTDGALVNEWDVPDDYSGDFSLNIAVDSQGSIYSSSVFSLSNSRVVKLDSSGNFLEEWTLPAPGAVFGPDREGRIHIVGDDLIVRAYLPTGEFCFEWNLKESTFGPLDIKSLSFAPGRAFVLGPFPGSVEEYTSPVVNHRTSFGRLRARFRD